MSDIDPAEPSEHADPWADLSSWERRQVARSLRVGGLSYREIRQVVPIPKATLSMWLQDVELTDAQSMAIKARTAQTKGVPRDTQRRRRIEVERIRSEARVFARERVSDPLWISGVTLYWAEGAKTKNYLDVSNSDPRMLRAFVLWVRRYLDADAEFVLALHLHEGNDETAAKAYWRSAIGLPDARFTKTYIKPKGTGHRKNHLEFGVCRVRTRNASNHWHRVMEWIDVASDHLTAVGGPHC